MSPRPLRVLQLITRPQRRGAEIFARDLCGALERQGHATRIVALYGAEGGHELPLRTSDLRLGGQGRSPLEKLPGFHPGLLRRLLAAVDDFAPDVVQVNGSRTVKYGSLLRRLRRRAPWVLVYRSIGNPTDWVGGGLRRTLYRRLVVAPVDGLVAVSEATRRSFEEAYGPMVPGVVLPRGVALDGFVPEQDRASLRRSLGTPQDRPVLLYVGSLTAETRPDRLVRVATDVAVRLGGLLELWVVGDGPRRDEVEAAVAMNTGDLQIRPFGHRDDVASFMAAADLLLLTSDTEGTPGVVLEAGAVGTPSVATRVGGVAECVVEGETGLLADPEDEAGLAAAATALLADPAARRRLGAAAARRVREHFTVANLAVRYVEFYRRVRELYGREA